MKLEIWHMDGTGIKWRQDGARPNLTLNKTNKIQETYNTYKQKNKVIKALFI